MKKFDRPEVKFVMNDELAEGIYMRSGDTWSVTYRPQNPQMGACYMDGATPKCAYQIDGYHIDGTQSNSTTFKITFSKPLSAAMIDVLKWSLDAREYAVVGDTIYYYYENRSWSQFGMGQPTYSYNPAEGSVEIIAFSVTDGKADVPWISKW